MKNRKTISILLLLTAVIWGVIFYRIFFAGPKPVHAVQTIRTAVAENAAQADASFTIRADYRDPFLDNYAEPRKVVNVEVKKKTAPIPLPQPVKPQPVPVVWPSVKYAGMISGKTGTKKVAMIVVNGRENTIREGQYFLNDLKLVSVTKDSIQLLYRKENRMIGRSF